MLFICNDMTCIEYNNYLRCSLINDFCYMRQPTKFIHVKNNRVKYSRDLFWLLMVGYSGMYMIVSMFK